MWKCVGVPALFGFALTHYGTTSQPALSSVPHLLRLPHLPHFPRTGVAALIELAAEPLYILALVNLEFKLR